jgi:hypothetical protein
LGALGDLCVAPEHLLIDPRIVDWVIQHLKGKGPPSYADCTDFFGASTRACDIYKNEDAASSPREPTTVGK